MNNKHILITGASRGIGLEIAKMLAEKNYSLVLTTSNEISASKLSEMSFVKNNNVKVYALDQENKLEIASFIKKWDQELWGIVHNAGICKTLGIKDEGDDPLDEVLNTNLIGPYLLTKKLLPFLSRPGRIVNITSQLGHEGRAEYSAYCASKFGLIGMTKCWAKELGEEGITVNAVSPGWVDTEMGKLDMNRMAEEAGKTSEQYYKEICKPLELKRFNSTTEVANLVSFLLSEEASGITGRDWLMQTIWNEL
ncbi:MAG: SDR family oxidoreductase [Sulfurovum sp.]|nr:SDR family oxidoreductase [Sulfurovum sp.]